MPGSDAGPKPQHSLSAEAKALVSISAALAMVDFTGEELARFDKLSAHCQQNGSSLREASEALSEPVTCQVIAIVAVGHAYNWSEGGAEAALTLPGYDDFRDCVANGEAKHFDLVRLAVKAMRDLAWARVAVEEERLGDAGKSLLELVPVTLTVAPDATDIALELALASHDLLAPSGDPNAREAQALAYRLLVWSKRLPFLADLPPRKFPPPLFPRFPSGTLLELCLRFIEDGIVAQPIDLGATARDMLEDPETVVWNDVAVEIDGRTEQLRMEAAFGPALLRWALDDESGGTKTFGVSADDKIRVLLKLLCENRMLLERHRNDDLSDIYVAAYLGADPTARAMELAMTVETVDQIVRCNVGLSEEDAHVSSMPNRFFAPREAEVIAHLKVSIAAERRAN